MNKLFPLTQFEVRFTQILNFNQVIRETLSPYLRMSSSFNFANQGQFEESIRINFEEDRYSIDCRWDRIVFLSEGNPEIFSKQNSVMKIFWEIVEKLTQVSTFGALRNCLFVSFEINILDLNQTEILKMIKDKFFTQEIENIMKGPTELAIILEKVSSTKQTTVTFGPYSKSDNKKYNLFPFKREKSYDDIEGKFGTLLKFQIFDEFTKFDSGIFKRFVEEQKSYSSQFIIQNHSII